MPHRGRILNRIPSRDTERDWTHEQATAVINGLVATPPPSCDLRKTGWAIGDQGDTGSCVGWGTADGVLRYQFAMAGRWPLTSMLSPRFLWMASKETDQFHNHPSSFIEEEGTSLKAACKVATKYGVVPTSVLPMSGALYRGDGNTFYAQAAQYRARSYHNLQPFGVLDPFANYKRWLSTVGPVLIGCSVDATWDACGPANGGVLGVFHPSTVRGGHCVALVGYRTEPNNQTTFIVRNSWGTSWGDKGFAYAASEYAAASFSEAYGLVV